ncbi:VOC family protein [Pedobacter montanisoli]|uniref:Glyoxalase n=1 Tax=Pedobacter montanisoli TaxID=2923277 RepID=A0ABS9ZZR4_9SPHI|nr:glyoxalase [Pedobacter montanisoli]MCJ0743782.1 glyoxalase [Pedobacter montanisoli]
MTAPNCNPFVSAVFLTFSGNCKEALTFYQSCFGGTLRLETFEKGLQGYAEMPIVSASLVAESIVIHGSDLVHNEGRIPGNHMAIFIQCIDVKVRRALIQKLEFNKKILFEGNYNEKLIEITDVFDVRWVLYV